MAKCKDLTGLNYGRLTVISRDEDRTEPSGRKRVYWLCKCECGKVVSVQYSALKAGKTKSCGCLKTERNKKHFTKHGFSKERLYQVWTDIKKRCSNPNYKQYKDYGGRGIIICDEWKNDYLFFRDWALKNGYNPYAKYGECTIDRIDVNGNYEPNNCRWVTIKQQNNNKRGVCNGF